MTDMKRVTVSIPADMDNKIIALRKKSEYARCSYSEIVRRLVLSALSETAHNKKRPLAER